MDKITLSQRIKNRESLVKKAKDYNINRLSEQYIGQYRSQLESLDSGDKVEENVPVGKEKFLNWTKEMIENYYPELSGILDNDRTLKDYAAQVAETIAKSPSGVMNPLRDYSVSDTPIFVKAQSEFHSQTPAKPKIQNMFTAPQEHSRHCPEHPGVMMRRVKDNLYQCPITGDFHQQYNWKDNYGYRDGHEVNFDFGVQNQSSGKMNKIHPLLALLPEEMEEVVESANKLSKGDGEEYNTDELYGVFKKNKDLITPSSPYVEGEEKVVGNPRPKESQILQRITKKAQFFAPTTMSSRQCPDHPGQQLMRVSDSVRQCPLDRKVYDFERGFTTADGKKHNGGQVSNQNSIPPGSIVIRLDKQASLQKESQSVDSQRVHSFLWNAVQYLPAESKERQILNRKFQKNLSLEDAILQQEEAERLVEEQKSQIK